jgi:hypothetical protein
MNKDGEIKKVNEEVENERTQVLEKVNIISKKDEEIKQKNSEEAKLKLDLSVFQQPNTSLCRTVDISVFCYDCITRKGDLMIDTQFFFLSFLIFYFGSLFENIIYIIYLQN